MSFLKTIIDFDDFTDFQTISQTKYTTLTLAKKKSIPSKLYILKTFRFNCSLSKYQKIISQTFSQIHCTKTQYLEFYKQYSFSSLTATFNPTFSMKYISSNTLEKVLQSPDFLTKWKINDILNCLFAVAEGMLNLHKHLIRHGNLCPSNIIIDEAKQCYLCDFGLYPMKKLYIDSEELDNKEYREPNMSVFSPTMKNDVYSFGVLICHLFLIFTRQQKQESFLKDFLKSKKSDKYELFPKIFKEIVPKCLSLNSSVTFYTIVEMFQKQSCQIESIDMNVNDLYYNFIKTRYIENLAKLDDSNALYKLGKLYDNGILEDENKVKTLINYKKAAILNNSEAQSHYGVLLQDMSDGDKKKMEEGALYIKKSAEQGNVHGITNYGIILYNGSGVKKDFNESEKYLKKAADIGYDHAQVIYGVTIIYNNPTPERKEEGLFYIKKAISQNYPFAYFSYGRLLQAGEYIVKDESLAMDYFKVAADLDHEESMMEYANGNLHGIGIPINKNNAIKYYQLAANKGNEEAIQKLNELKESENINQEKKEKQSEKTKDFETDAQKNLSDKKKAKHNQEALLKIIEKQAQKIKELEESYKNKYEKEKEENQKRFEEQEKKIKEQEEKMKELEEHQFELSKQIEAKKLSGEISVNVYEYNIIKGTIITNENGVVLDYYKSRYILDENNSPSLGINSYENGDRIKSLSHKVLFLKTKGTYYLHALLVDIYGNKLEIVSQPLVIK